MRIFYLLFSIILFFSITSYSQQQVAQSSKDSIAAAGQSPKDSSKYYIVLESGEIIYGDSRTYTPLLGKLRVIQNEKEYSLSEVKQVISSKGYFMKYISKGFFLTEESLAKRTTEGKIDLYSDYVTNTTFSLSRPATFSGATPSTTYEEICFSKDKINLLPIDYSNLMDNLSDNPSSMEHLKNYNTLTYVKYGLVAVGLATVIAGIAQIDKKEGLSSGAKTTMILGGVIANLAWIPHLLQGNCLKDAISAYNR